MAVEKSIGYYELKLEGGIVPLKFGIPALEIYAELNGIGFAEVYGHVSKNSGISPTRTIARILLAGAKNYEEIEQTGKDYSYKTAIGWIEELGYTSEQVINAMNTFYKSILPADIEENEPEETGTPKKKKVSPSPELESSVSVN